MSTQYKHIPKMWRVMLSSKYVVFDSYTCKVQFPLNKFQFPIRVRTLVVEHWQCLRFRQNSGLSEA